MNTKSKNAEAEDSGKKPYKRRHFLVDRRRQLAATVRIVGLVFILLFTLNAVIAWQSYTTTNQVLSTNPEIGERMRANDLRNLAIMGGISLIILAMVVVRSIMLTHRTAGAVFKVAQCMEKIASGDFDVTLRLRNDDNLRALEDPFNKMAKTLLRYADEDHRSMTKLANEIEEHGNPVDAEMMRRIADSRGRKTH
jgi:nitrogen fixation/metabolism regulation signal transduction histidine kinase